MKKIYVLPTLFIISIIVLLNFKWNQNDIQESISNKIIRFHVIADNDSDEAQALKLKVRDEVLTYMKTIINNDENLEETRQLITDNIASIEEHARQVIEEEGYEYTVSASLEYCYFPIKEYEEFIFPAGNYESLLIRIGEAKGKNWWCVMYPNLCFVEGTYAVVDDEARVKLKDILTHQEYETLISGTKTKIKFKYLTFLN